MARVNNKLPLSGGERLIEEQHFLELEKTIIVENEEDNDDLEEDEKALLTKKSVEDAAK